jgi:hypothetical protein
MLNALLWLVVGLVGIAGHYWVGRRRFYRRGETGIDLHPSYLHAVLVPKAEWIADAVAGLMILVGFVGFFAGLAAMRS